MKKINKTVCGTCDATLDISELEPFYQFRCPGCGTELYVPAVLGHIRLDIPRGETACFKKYDGFDAKKNIYITMLCRESGTCGKCQEAEIDNAINKEVEILRKFQHPNICPISDFSQISAYTIVASPRMDGFDFSEYDPNIHGLLNLEKILIILQKAAVGLAAAHHKGIIHHDISAANLHLDSRGNIRWKNFFISRFIYYHCKETEILKKNSQSVYASPEKFTGSNETKEGDIFSFAVLSYYLITGKFPFGSESDDKERISSKDPISIKQYREDIDKDIEYIIMRMLSPDPLRRLHLADFISAVNIYLAELERDRIYESQWNMVISSTDTKQIPKMDKVGLKAEDLAQLKADEKHGFSLKSLLEHKRRKK